MAQVILTAVGTAIGGPIGGRIGSLIGGYVDKKVGAALTPAHAVGRQLAGLQLNTATEGAPIPLAFGRARVGGQIIWAARFKESRIDQSGGGGKSTGGGSSGGPTYRYAYSLSFAVGLCEGPVDGIGRIWADGKALDVSRLTIRTYLGGPDQTPDSLICAIEGDAPAYRGLAYLVFEDLDLTPFGDRPPAINVEVFRRPVWPGEAVRLEDQLQAVCLIPGAGETVYATTPVLRQSGYATSVTENVNTASGGADLRAALDQMQAALPNVARVSLVSAWFGTDLRCGACQIAPGVELRTKATLPFDWSAGGASRSAAHLISMVGTGPAYGGTPSDRSVLEAIAEITGRGLRVTLYPFVMMDIPAGNTLPDPYGGASQAAYPWRGRITASLAPGRAGSPDRTAAVRAEVQAFFGTARAVDFSVSPGGVSYHGPAEWSYRRMVLHHAALAAASGGVDSFLIGSELRGLTTLRDEQGYPAVDALAALARECRALLGPNVKIGYAADWTEYGAYVPADGSGDVSFPLDPLWSDASIDFVGIDLYPPVTDWRDGTAHLDAQAGFGGPADPAYLAARIAGGEAYDWYYASDADRLAQTRTPITDGAYGEPWIYRAKDLTSWWSNRHYNRKGGVRLASPTSWSPGMKPMRLTEFGCAAIDKGANAPNRFLDPKSSENALPPFSSGGRDDLGQRCLLEAVLSHYADPAASPISPVYGGPMIASDAVAVWCWDARPFPEFPARSDLWADASAWGRGHWLTGRAGAGDLADLIAALLLHAGLDPTKADLSGASGIVQGFVVDKPARLIDTLSELALAFPFDLAEREGRLALVARDMTSAVTLDPTTLGLPQAAAVPVTRHRALKPAPDRMRVGYADLTRDYQTGEAYARSPSPEGGGASQANLPLCLTESQARAVGLRRLARARAELDTVEIHLPADLAHRIEPGDGVRLAPDAALYRVTAVDLSPSPRALATGAEAPDAGGPAPADDAYKVSPSAQPSGPPAVALMDLPPLPGSETDTRPLVAAVRTPWRSVSLSAGASADVLSQRALLSAPAVMGLTATALSPGVRFRFDVTNTLDVQLGAAALSSASQSAVLSGANAAAVQADNGEWELIQFLNATLIAAGRWRLSGLLRAQGGSDLAMRAGASAGQPFVLLDGTPQRADVAASERGLALTWRAAAAGTTSADVASATLTAVWNGIALRPWAPCQLTAARTAAGDIALSWIRRARLSGDALDGDPPLSEEREFYRVEVHGPDGALVRVLSPATSSVIYAAADQKTDFGGPAPSGVRVTVAQGSAIYGFGAPSDPLML